MKKKMELDEPAKLLRNLRKFQRNVRKFWRNIRKFQTFLEVPEKCSEVPDFPDFFTKSKHKIIYFKMLLKFPCMKLMMTKMKSMRINLMMKKLKNQSKENKMYHIQECTKAFNATILSITY